MSADTMNNHRPAEGTQSETIDNQQPGSSNIIRPQPEWSITSSVIPKCVNEDMKECEGCHMDFLVSYLYRNFGLDVCDDCRDPKVAHELITRTDAKSKYLLKDCDLDSREPALRYILKKNPYAQRGDMRLYLKYQVEQRALEVHGSEEKLEQEIEEREEKRSLKRQRAHDKKMKKLRMEVRSSLYKRTVAEVHEHDFSEPVYLPDDDLYEKECTTCGHKITYEEM
ncbi:DNA repair protein complementing XP-A cells-like protein, partial [Fragariocoptes setiger]